jgi:hypothetical protein
MILFLGFGGAEAQHGTPSRYSSQGLEGGNREHSRVPHCQNEVGSLREIFNSDVYDNWVNPTVAGNGGGVTANGPGLHGFATSASITIPANGLVVFAE